MRGKGQNLFGVVFNQRITPAHAGKRVGCYTFVIKFKDHPRTCGEKFYSVVSAYGSKKSPPHMRGKVIAERG